MKPWEHQLHQLSKYKLCKSDLAGLAIVPHLLEFAVFLTRTKSFNVFAIIILWQSLYIVSVVYNLKTMAGGHAVHE